MHRYRVFWPMASSQPKGNENWTKSHNKMRRKPFENVYKQTKAILIEITGERQRQRGSHRVK